MRYDCEAARGASCLHNIEALVFSETGQSISAKNLQKIVPILPIPPGKREVVGLAAAEKEEELRDRLR